MTRLEFNELVENLAAKYDGRPRALAWATAGWLIGGYLALFSGLIAALVVGTVLIVVGLVLAHHLAAWLVMGGVVLVLVAIGLYGRFIWTPGTDSKEFILHPGDAPDLHALIEELRRTVGCRRFHRILLTSELNAGVATVPRFGLLGGSRSTLMLGLPLLEALTPDEFRAVLAHEFVHHSQNHGRFAAWVYRVRSTWERVFQDLESGQRSTSVAWARKFLRWYWPRMNARAFLLCREHEYAADSFSVEQTGSHTAATALWRIETIHRYGDLTFWPSLQRAPELSPEPPVDFMARFVASLSEAADSDVANWCSASTFARLTDTGDTHPSWTDRTLAMGEDPTGIARQGFPLPPRLSAAKALLAADHGRLTREISNLWSETVRKAWQAQHRRLIGQRRRLAEILPLFDARPDDHSLHWERAQLVQELDGPEAVRPLLEQIRERNPQHRGTTFELGQLALNLGDATGKELLEEIIHQRRDSFYVPACHALCGYFRLTGRFDDMREMEARLDGRDAWAEWIHAGHRHLARDVACLPHGLTSEELAPVISRLQPDPDLAAAWLVRADCRFPGAPTLFVLCVSGASSRFSLRRSAAEQQLALRLAAQIPLPGRVLVIASRGPDCTLARRVQALPDSQIFARVEAPLPPGEREASAP